jgi:hypothetical protein
MALTQPHRGFALLIAVIFMAVMLAFSLTLTSLAYKQTILASSAADSQIAFYAADAGLECLLFSDQRPDLTSGNFDYATRYASGAKTSPAPITCNGKQGRLIGDTLWGENDAGLAYFAQTQQLDLGAYCADVTIYKYENVDARENVAYLFSQGYSVPCDKLPNATRYAARGLQSHY